ncbi:MAG: pilus assembly protein PilM, partial [Eubacteriales bacterium]|nr:pilus assembly protein PilM [Eubacteriales bacterium]
MPIKQPPTISVDIGHSNLKILQTAPDGKIVKFVVHKMPEGCVDDLNIFSDEALSNSLKTARKKAKLPYGKCNLVLSGSDIIIRYFTLPILEEGELYENILHEISGYLPVDPEKYYVDYKIAGIVKEDGIDMYKVLVTTAHKRMINSYKRILRSAGFNATVIDTCENAREKMLRYNYEKDNSFPIKGGICIIDLGTKHTRVNIYFNGYYYVSNVLKRSSQSITDIISQNTGKDVLVSESIKRENDFLNQEHENSELKSAVTYEVDSLLYEITRVFDYFRNRTKETIHAIYISGGGSLLPGLKKYMEIHTGIPVHYASDLITATKANKSVDNKAFAFLLNAYTA